MAIGCSHAAVFVWRAFSDAAVTGTLVGAQGFVREASRTIVIEGKNPAELLDKLAAYKRKLSAPVLCLTYIKGMLWCSNGTF